MRRTVPPSAEIEEQIEQLLAVGVGENPRESLSELALAFMGEEHSARMSAVLPVVVLSGHFGRTLAGACLSSETQVFPSERE